MRLSGTKTNSINQYRGLGNQLWDLGGSRPSLDLNFADSKSLVDATTGQSLVTFTRASSGTYVGSDGVVKTAVTNLLLRSEEFDNVAWVKFNSTISTNTTTSPIGTQTADSLVETSTNTTHVVYQDYSTTRVGTYAYSIYLKANQRTRVQLILSDSGVNNVNALFNLSAGAVISQANSGTGSGVSATIQEVGSGWYRCTLAGSPANSLTAIRPHVYLLDSANNQVYAGDGTSGIYLWGAQLEQSSTVGEYIPTTSTINSAPRFDHHPTTGESLGLLVEEQRTNSIRNNTMVDAVAGTPGTLPTNWLVSGVGTLTQQIVEVGTVNGINYIDLRLSGTTSTTQFGIRFETNNGVPGTNGQTFTYSAWFARIAGSLSNISGISCNANFYDAANAFVASAGFTGFDSTNQPTSLIRRAGTLTIASATSAFIQPQIFLTFNSGVAIDITLRIGLPQLEQGAFATSVIPTSTVAVTRSADVASITGTNFSSWYRQDAQTWYGEYAPGYTASATAPPNTPHLFQVYANSSSTNNYAVRAATNTVNQEYVARNPTVGSQFVQNAGIGYGVAGVNRKISYGIDSSTLNVSTNGSAISSLTNNVAALMAAHDTLALGSGTGGSPPYTINGTIRRLTYWPQRLSNSTLQTITQ
jgi:hypothetical protein